MYEEQKKVLLVDLIVDNRATSGDNISLFLDVYLSRDRSIDKSHPRTHPQVEGALGIRHKRCM